MNSCLVYWGDRLNLLAGQLRSALAQCTLFSPGDTAEARIGRVLDCMELEDRTLFSATPMAVVAPIDQRVASPQPVMVASLLDANATPMAAPPPLTSGCDAIATHPQTADGPQEAGCTGQTAASSESTARADGRPAEQANPSNAGGQDGKGPSTDSALDAPPASRRAGESEREAGPAAGAAVVLIDNQLTDSDLLIEAVRPGNELFVYNSGVDSADALLSRIRAWADTTETRIQSLSILSHGAAGGFELGDQWITASNLGDTSAEWQALSSHFSGNAVIAIYGCNVAAEGGDGQALLDALSRATGAEVYASTDVTGAGGDWVLEASSLGSTEGSSLAAPLDAARLEGANVSLAWYSASWQYRQTVTIDEAMVTGTSNLSNFAVLVSVTDGNLKSTANGGHVAQADGGDILFTSADGTTKLDHEIESYNPATGALIAWVRVPTLDFSTNTALYVYYGNAGAADQWNVSGTWESNYKGVWHLGSDYADSTNNNNDGTNSGSTNYAAAQIGSGDDFNGTSSKITTTSTEAKTANSFMLSLWFNADATDFAHHLIWEGDSVGNGYGNPTTLDQEMHISLGNFTMAGVQTSNVLTFFMGDNFESADSINIETPLSDTSGWHHVTVAVTNLGTAPTATMYLDGASVGTDTGTTAGTSRANWDTPLRFGQGGTAERYYDGGLDEVRLATTSRSSSWVQTEYNNQSDPAAFVTLAAEENSFPVNHVPGAQTTSEDTALVFSAANGNQISVSDGNAESNAVEVTLSVTNGTLTLNGVTGLTFAAGDGTTDATMTFRGTVSNVNNALNGLSYAPTANYNGGATLTLTTIDSNIVSLNIDAENKGRYTFDNAGDLGNDSSPAGAYDGTVSGATAVVDGTRGNVLSFDGNDYVQVSGHFGNPTNVTLAAWVNLTTADTGGAEVISLGNNSALRLDDAAGLKGFIYNGSTWKPVAYATTLAGTGWHHVAYTFNDAGNVQKLYLDGVEVASLAETGSISYTQGANSTIGSYNNGNSSFDFNGKIDDARVYDRVLTAEEIASLASDLSLRDTDSVATTVTAVNDAPALAAIEGTALAYTENDAATAITTSITASDVDSTNLASATIQITGNYQNGQDVLSFTNTASITGSWNATTGTLSLSGSDTVANYQAALRAVMYQNTSDNPSGLTRTVTFKVNDGSTDSNTQTRNIAVTPVNDAPVLAAIEGTALAYTENGAATAITTSITASDVDNANLASATIQITGNYQNGQDLLSFANTANITGSWNATTGMLTLSGSDTAANYQTALRAVKYQNSSDNPSGLTRTVTFLVNDASIDSNTQTRNIAVTAVNDAPVLAAIEGTALAYAENDAATAISDTITASDFDNTNLAGATIKITSNYQNGRDVLSFTNTASITGSWSPATATLSLSGSDTVANYQAALRAVKYQNNSESPSGLTRTVTFQVNDGSTDSNTQSRNIVATPVNDAPVLAATEGTALAYTENDSATAITGTITASDVDNTNLACATIQITGNYQNGQDVLSFTNTASITGSWNATTGMLTLSGSDTVANYQAALRAVKYQNTSDNPSGLTRTATFQVNDGAAGSNVQTRNITVSATNDAPVLVAIEGTALAYTENDPATGITATIAAGDVDSTNLAGATIQITGNYQNGQDVLSFVDTSSITGNWNATTGRLTLSGSDTVANYQAALRAVKYENISQSPSGLTRTVSFAVNDGTVGSNLQTRDISFTPVDDAPVLAGIEGTALVYTENDPARIVSSTITVSDIDDTNLTGATIQITGNYQSGRDLLSFTDTANITGTWNPSNGALTLVGLDTVANYQAALRTVKYENISQSPSGLTRTVSFAVNDGTVGSNLHTRDINFTPVDDAPVLAGIEGSTLVYTENDAPKVISSTITASDIDDTNLTGATIQITGNYQNGEDVLSFTDTANITGSWNATTGMLTLQGSDTVGNYQAALRAVKYQDTTDMPSGLTRTVTFQTNDGALSSNLQSRDIAFNTSNDAPQITVPASQVLNEDGTLLFSLTNGNRISIADVDAGGGVVQLSLLATHGTLTLSDVAGLTFVGGANGTGWLQFTGTVNAINVALNGMFFTPDADFHGPAGIGLVVSDLGNSGSGGPLSDTRGVAITVQPVNDAPAITSDGGGPTATVPIDENTAQVTTVTASDVDGDILRFSVVGGADAGQFEIDSLTGVLRFLAAPDYEHPADAEANNVYEVIVRVQDGNGGTDLQTLTVAVIAVNETGITPISDEDAAADFVWEDAPSGAVVGVTAHADDADAGDTISYRFDNANGPFAIDSATGIVTLNGALDYETAASYTITVRATSSDGSFSTRDFTIAVGDIADTGPVLDLDADNSGGETGSGYRTTWTEDGLAVPLVDRDALLTDPGSNTLESLSVRITNLLDGAAELLAACTEGTSLAAHYDNAAGVLSLTGADTLDNYQKVLRSVTYVNQSQNPSPVERVVEFIVHDGVYASNVATSRVAVHAVNDAPVLVLPAPQQTAVDELVFGSATNNLITLSDVDAGGGAIRVNLAAIGGTLTLARQEGLTFELGDGRDDAAFAVRGSIAEIQSALDGLRFRLGTQAASLQVSVDDLGQQGQGGTQTATGSVAIIQVYLFPVPVTPPTTTPGNDTPADTSGEGSKTPSGVVAVLPAAARVPPRPARLAASDSAASSASAEIGGGSGSRGFGDASATGASGAGRSLAGDLRGLAQVNDYQSNLRPGSQLASRRQTIFDGSSRPYDSAALQTDAGRPRTWESWAIGTATGVTTVVSIGYVLWFLRGSSLLSCAMSAMPVWSGFDPLPVLDFATKESNRGGKGKAATATADEPWESLIA